MSENFVVSEATIDIPNPLKLYGVGGVIIGATLSLMGLDVLFGKGYLSYLNFQGISYFNNFIIGILSMLCLSIGIIQLSFGLKSLFSWLVPAHAPKNYSDINTIFATLRSSDLDTYKKPETFSLKVLRAFFSDKVFYLTSVPRDIAHGCIKFLLGTSIFSAFLIFFWDVLPLGYIFTRSLIVLMIIASILGIILTILIIPRSLPTARRTHEAQDIHGGHPKKLYRSSQDGAREIGYDYPYRFKGSEPSMDNVGVQDTGTVEGYAFVESQPYPTKHQYNVAAIFSLLCGAIFYILGFKWLVYLDPVIYPTLDGMILPIPITGFIVIGIGSSFLGRASKLFNLLRFESKAILTDIEGEFYKSDLGVGTSMQDSLRSQRLAVISDSRLNHYAADVLSECYTLKGEREIVAINDSSKINDDLQSLREFIESQRKPDLEVQGIDFEQPSASKLLQQNIAISAIKAGQQPQLGYGQNALLQPEVKPPQQIEGKNIRICPKCGTKSEEAKFCPNCGTKLS